MYAWLSLVSPKSNNCLRFLHVRGSVSTQQYYSHSNDTVNLGGSGPEPRSIEPYHIEKPILPCIKKKTIF